MINKLTPKSRWILIYTAIGLASPFSLLFPIAFQLRFLKKYNPFWFILDDSRKNPDGTLAEDYRIYLQQFREGKPLWVNSEIKQIIGVLSWHILRNRVWNLVDSFPVDNGNPTVGLQNIRITKLIKDDLKTYNGTKVVQDGPYVAAAALKFVGKPGDDPYQVNRGEIISIEHSIIGEGEIEYTTPSGWIGWRYTSCTLVRPWYLLGAKRWRTVFLGTNANRYSLKFKHTTVKPWGTWK